MNPLLLAVALGTNHPIDLCSSVKAWESPNGAYMVPIVQGNPTRGVIDEFWFLANEVTNAANPRSPITVNIAIYNDTDLLKLQTLGSTPTQVQPLWFRQCDTNNGLTITPIEPETVATNCLETTNLWLVRIPVKTPVSRGTWIAFWFPPNHISWKVPPYLAPNGCGGIVHVYQSCRYTMPAGGMGYFCKPLSAMMNACDLPYWVIFRPAMTATLSPGPSITINTGSPMPLLLRSASHVIAVTNTVTLPATNGIEIFTLEKP